MDFTTVKNIVIPEGPVKKIEIGGQTVWKAYDAEVDYLESTGTQYIDTGIVPLLTDVHHVDFQYLDISTDYTSVYGSLLTDITPYERCHLMVNDNGYIAVSVQSSHQNLVTADLNRHYFTLDFSNLSATIDSTTISLLTPGIPDNSMYIYACHQNTSTVIQNSKLRIYSFEVVGRINLIPVRVGNVGYFYDTISGKLYGNIGTGSFIIGPDVVS